MGGRDGLNGYKANLSPAKLKLADIGLELRSEWKMADADLEINSFLIKFRQLWIAGFDAHLNLETQAGNAWVGLKVNLGKATSKVEGKTRQKRQSPSRLRRREKRAADRFEYNVNLENTQEFQSDRANNDDDANLKVEDQTMVVAEKAEATSGEIMTAKSCTVQGIYTPGTVSDIQVVSAAEAVPVNVPIEENVSEEEATDRYTKEVKVQGTECFDTNHSCKVDLHSFFFIRKEFIGNRG